MDVRCISSGYEIPSELYSDQPYVVKAPDGAWVCVMTTGKGHEGNHGQHIIATRSLDCGRTWSTPVAVEPAQGPEASYAVSLAVPSGRIYCFYNHNTDNIREVIADNPPYVSGMCSRVDSQGYFVFKFSDDGGLSWSDKRYPIPVREMDIDRQNPYSGRIRFFWNVGRPFVRGDVAYVPLHKVGGFGEGFFVKSEGVFLRSDNLLFEADPESIRWETLPNGEMGLRTPPGGGPISEEHSAVVLSDGSLYCVYRSTDGHPVCSISRDGGYNWSIPSYQRYADGRIMKHPRAANFVWKCTNGKYLYWFHNHGGRGYDDRNPAWICGGVEISGPEGLTIAWSQPEVVLYDDDVFIRMSYPDLIEEDGRYFLTETQKDIARVHEVSVELLEGLWGQFDSQPKTSIHDGLVFEWDGTVVSPCPRLPSFCTRDNSMLDYRTKQLRTGFSIKVEIFIAQMPSTTINLVSNRDEQGRGFALSILPNGRLELILDDGRTRNSWDTGSDRVCPGEIHQLTAVVDGGPCIIMFIFDGRLCDGGDDRQFGWGRFSPNLMNVNGSSDLTVYSNEDVTINELRIFDRALSVSEALF